VRPLYSHQQYTEAQQENTGTGGHVTRLNVRVIPQKGHVWTSREDARWRTTAKGWDSTAPAIPLPSKHPDLLLRKPLLLLTLLFA